MHKKLLTSAAVLALMAGGAYAQGPPMTEPPAPQAGGDAAATTTSPQLQVVAPRPTARAPQHRYAGRGYQRFSTEASNIVPSDTYSVIAPQLPVPDVAEGAGATQFLNVAQDALQNRRTGLAQESMERAATRLLGGETTQAAADLPDLSPPISGIYWARQALGHGDLNKAERLVAEVQSMNGQGTGW